MRYTLLFAFLLACTPTPPPEPFTGPPDATDGAPTPTPIPPPVVVVGDGGAAPASPECIVACQRLAAAGCHAGADPHTCGVVLQMDQDKKRLRTPSGKALTCSMIVPAVTQADMRALGIACP